MADSERQRIRGKGHPVLLRLPHDMATRLTVLARQRSLPLATVTRQLVKERLDHLDTPPETQPTAAQLLQLPIAERRRVLTAAAAAAAAAEENRTNRDLTDFEAFGEDDLYVEPD